MIWAKEETLTRQEMSDLQFNRLKETLNRIYEKVPAYREKMNQVELLVRILRTLMIWLSSIYYEASYGQLSIWIVYCAKRT